MERELASLSGGGGDSSLRRNLRPLIGILPRILSQNHDESSDSFSAEACTLRNLLWPQYHRINQASELSLSLTPKLGGSRVKRGRDHATPFYNEESSETTTFESNGGGDEKNLLNLFV